ncbi:hypothetical protein ACFVH0_39805 [Streptomyces sp. NPDC127117]|uniref:hypothetical protein n=1 Tax=Streptomyces sp. NPDC127117 TaxID=3345368 RepID=UPI003628780E
MMNTERSSPIRGAVVPNDFATARPASDSSGIRRLLARANFSWLSSPWGLTPYTVAPADTSSARPSE